MVKAETGHSYVPVKLGWRVSQRTPYFDVAWTFKNKWTVNQLFAWILIPGYSSTSAWIKWMHCQMHYIQVGPTYNHPSSDMIRVTWILFPYKKASSQTYWKSHLSSSVDVRVMDASTRPSHSESRPVCVPNVYRFRSGVTLALFLKGWRPILLRRQNRDTEVWEASALFGRRFPG